MVMNLFETAIEIAKVDEGFSSKPYRDTNNILTIGYGTNIEQGIDHTEAQFLLQHRLGLRMRECIRYFPSWFPRLDDVRKIVIVLMAYQMGMKDLLGFRKMLAACQRGDWDTAADEMLDSKWHRQDSPARAARMSQWMRTGSLQTSARRIG